MPSPGLVFPPNVCRDVCGWDKEKSWFFPCSIFLLKENESVQEIVLPDVTVSLMHQPAIVKSENLTPLGSLGRRFHLELKRLLRLPVEH